MEPGVLTLTLTLALALALALALSRNPNSDPHPHPNPVPSPLTPNLNPNRDQESFRLSYGARRAAGVSLRVMHYLCWMNTKVRVHGMRCLLQ